MFSNWINEKPIKNKEITKMLTNIIRFYLILDHLRTSLI